MAFAIHIKRNHFFKANENVSNAKLLFKWKFTKVQFNSFNAILASNRD